MKSICFVRWLLAKPTPTVINSQLSTLKSQLLTPMNWLAHIFLAAPTVESRLGNLLGDWVKGAARSELNPELQRGIVCHTAIDCFTDRHPIVARSKVRITPPQRRFAGVIIDVLYDHLLIKNWDAYSDLPIDDFISEVYTSFAAYSAIPVTTKEQIDRMIRADLLRSYRDLAGVEAALRRISRRLERRMNRTFTLELAMPDIVEHYAALDRDFQTFFPELQTHITEYYARSIFN
jgi:acyl carrier protein phosphodiesterase